MYTYMYIVRQVDHWITMDQHGKDQEGSPWPSSAIEHKSAWILTPQQTLSSIRLSLLFVSTIHPQ